MTRFRPTRAGPGSFCARSGRSRSTTYSAPTAAPKATHCHRQRLDIQSFGTIHGTT
jgi:hypothetical protein